MRRLTSVPLGRTLPYGRDRGAERRPPLEARRDSLQPEGPFRDPVGGEAFDPSIDVARDLVRDEMVPDLAK
jgi:hypothetical protein